MPYKYQKRQVDILRIELNKVYEKAVSEYGDEEMSWLKLGDMIESQLKNITHEAWSKIYERRRGQFSRDAIADILDVDFQTDNFRKFATGENSTMRPSIKLMALDIYLSETENGYSTLTKEHLNNKPALPKIASLLTEFLHSNTDYEPFIKSSQLSGYYQCQIDGVEVNLHLSEEHNPHILTAKINELVKPSKSKKSLDPKLIEYSGWVLIDPSDGLFGLFQNETLSTNHMIFPISIDEDVGLRRKARQLTFLNQPVDPIYTQLENSRTSKEIAGQWLYRDEGRILKFERVDDFS
ncbi:MAG: hypothetical protein ACRBDL_08825 [Alphaproteobacteria bacterium]